MTDLAKLKEAAENYDNDVHAFKFLAAPSAILSLIERLEKAEAARGSIFVNTEGRYVEYVAGDRATIVEDLQGFPHASALIRDMTTRAVIGVRIFRRTEKTP
jgi:chromosome segregation and condensation protein ScpB